MRLPGRARLRCFNPRSRAGSDVQAEIYLNGANVFQSTLPCGERRLGIFLDLSWLAFQSTLPCGERLDNSVSVGDIHVFQSTLPCGERPCRAASSEWYLAFQSTLPCGERLFPYTMK